MTCLHRKQLVLLCQLWERMKTAGKMAQLLGYCSAPSMRAVTIGLAAVIGWKIGAIYYSSIQQILQVLQDGWWAVQSLWVLSAWRLQYSKCGPLKQLSLEFLMTKMPSAYSQVTKWPRLTNRPNVEENWRHVFIDNIINVSPYLQHYFIMKKLKPKLDWVVKIRPTCLKLSNRIFN